MQIKRAGSQPSSKGPTEYFTGSVRIDPLHAGDVIWCPPGHKHWHGATPTKAMTHIAIQESLNGKNVGWLEKVTDEEYLRGVPQSAGASKRGAPA